MESNESAFREIPARVDGDGPLMIVTLGEMSDDCEVCRAIRAGKSTEEIVKVMEAPTYIFLKAGWGGR